jgi:hypothetical protein
VWEDIHRAVVDGAIYDILRILFGPLVLTILFALVGRYLKWFESVRQLILISVAVFVAVFVGFLTFSPRAQTPQLGGNIEYTIFGPTEDGKGTIAVLTVDVTNAGTMQSIAKNWNVTGTVNNINYQGLFPVPVPVNIVRLIP